MEQKLTLRSNVFLWLKGRHGLMYNSDNGTSMLFDVNDEISEMCSALLDYDNLYNVIIDCSGMKMDTKKFVSEIIGQNFGTINEVDAPTISLPPLLNILNDIGKLKKDIARSEGEHILEYLSTLTIYLGGKCHVNNDYQKQTFYPYYSEKTLESSVVINFMDKIKSPYLKKINIVISDITSDLYLLLNYLKSTGINTILYVHENIANQNISKLELLSGKNMIIAIICEAGIISENIMLKTKYDNYRYNFLVKSEDEYKSFENITSKFKISSYSIIPIFDNNLQFFRDNVFVNKEDIIGGTYLCKREIFAHQAVNANFWGTLTITPDGKIYSNLNTPSVGNINNSVYDIILTELDKNYAWRLLRKNKPCSECLFQWLCPPVSNYEMVMNKTNLCNL